MDALNEFINQNNLSYLEPNLHEIVVSWFKGIPLEVKVDSCNLESKTPHKILLSLHVRLGRSYYDSLVKD